MALLDKIFGRKKTLSELSKQELRKEEIMIGKQRDKLFTRIEDNAVNQDMYQERLDQILDLGQQADKDALASAGLTSAGQELMHLWDKMAGGELKEDEAFQEADKAVRRKQGAMEKEI